MVIINPCKTCGFQRGFLKDCSPRRSCSRCRSQDPERKKKNKAAMKKRWLQDADYRARKVAYNRKWRAGDPDFHRRRAIHKRKKYGTDIDFREAVKRTNRNYRARKLGALVDRDITLRDLLVLDGRQCGICGRSVRKAQASIDHIIPLSRGGVHSWGNIQLAHRSCNSSKGANLPKAGD